MTKSSISYDQRMFLSDEALTLMGKEKRVVKGIADENAGLLSHQSIFYWVKLCGKLSATMREEMISLIKLINLMRSHSALRHRQFKEFLSDCDAEQYDLCNTKCSLAQ